MKEIRVGVFMGGASLEREVSFNSGRTVCDHLHPYFYRVIPFFVREDGSFFQLPWQFLSRGKISDFLPRLEREGERVRWESVARAIDFAYLALHGSFTEDGCMQAFCSLFSLPHSGSSLFASAITAKKIFADTLLKESGIMTPPTVFFSKNLLEGGRDTLLQHIAEVTATLSFPFIVKPDEEGSSFGVVLVHSYEALLPAIMHAHTINPYKKQGVLLQKKIEGSEFSCVVIQKSDGTWHAYEPTEIVHPSSRYFFGYHDKYMPGSAVKFTPMRIAPEKSALVKATCVRVATILGAAGIIRVDGFINDAGVTIIDSNVFPGTAPSSFTFVQAALEGYSPAAVINHIIDVALPQSLQEKKNMLLATEEKNLFRIGVLMGGQNSEKEISLESGRNVFYKVMSLQKYSVEALYFSQCKKIYRITLPQLMKDTTEEIELTLQEDQEILWEELSRQFDFMFIALHGGFGENGGMQGILDLLHIPYNGSGVSASALCMNKEKTNLFLQQQGFSVPRHFVAPSLSLMEEEYFTQCCHRAKISFPLVVKPIDDGCSYLVAVCHEYRSVVAALQEAQQRGKEVIMIEEYIVGKEITIGVVEKEQEIMVLSPTYTPKKESILSIEEKFLPGEGENITPAPFSERTIAMIKQEIKKIYEALCCEGYVRIDAFLRENKGSEELVFIECNTLPALTPATCLFHQAAEENIRPALLIEMIILQGLRKRNTKRDEGRIRELTKERPELF